MFNQLLTGYSLPELGFLVVVFLAAIGLTYGVASLIRGNQTVDHLDSVLDRDLPAQQQGRKPDASWTEVVANVAKPIAKFNKPAVGWEKSDLKRRFLQAGWRGPHAADLFFGAKIIFGLGLPLFFFFLHRNLSWNFPIFHFYLILGGLMLAGYYVPNYWLNRAHRLRNRELFETFPDALDLLTICVEAGLGLEAAMARVSREIRLSSTVLADELELVTLEMRAGGGKERALRNLALRTGVEDIEGTVALLVQSERFGTSIGESLRIQSDMLRTKRQQRAEELAAKIAVKMVFPLVMCILPSIFVVAAGPAMIQIGKSFAEIFGGR